MFNAPQGAAGVSTSGGTESILMACLSARQKAYVERGVTDPEMSVPFLHFLFLLYAYTNAPRQDSPRNRPPSLSQSSILFWHPHSPCLNTPSFLQSPHPLRLTPHKL